MLVIQAIERMSHCYKQMKATDAMFYTKCLAP